MAFFNNANVKDSMFNYSNERRDSQYNVIEVSYLDRDDLFKQKIEYVEDTDDIKSRGILRTTAQTFGITSRAHAKRLGEHIIYSTINEDENVAFVGGLETLLCRPGDLVAINDEVKTLKRHVGRVLNVDPVTNSIYTNISLTASDFSSSGLTGEISVLIPTGKLQSEDFYNLAKSPSKLNISEIYQTDLPMRVTFQSTGRQVSPSLSYGSNFFIDTGCSGYPLFQDIRVGSPCSITVANTKQQIYKIQSIKELNLNEYEVIASKFDTGKFSEIEKGETGLMQDFFTAFPPARNTNVSEGNSVSLENKFQYELKFPRILTFATGNWNLQFDKIDLSGQWTSVADANSYNVELITPKYRSIKQIVTGTSAIFEDQTEVGRFTLKVTARNTGSYPNPISATSSSTTTVLSYTAPVRNNGIIQGFVISR
jgi:predicted phage tail protein